MIYSGVDRDRDCDYGWGGGCGSDEVQDSASARLGLPCLASPHFGDRDWLGFKRLLGLALPRLASRWTRVDRQVIGLWYRILFSFCD